MPEFSVFVAGEAKVKPVDHTGRGAVVWNAETPTAGHASIPVALDRIPGLPCTLSVEIKFSGAPGSFEVAIQTADTPQDAYFVTQTSITAVNSSQVGRKELINVVASYARLLLVSRGNSVTITAKIN